MNIGALIVDDEADIRFLMRTLIETENRGLFVSGEAADGQDALDQIDALNPHVVVLDERMPGRSGIETLALLLERRPDLKVVLCSAHLDPELRRRAEAAGARVCLSKNQIHQVPAIVRELGSEGRD